jgi:hypothetical protein
MTGTGDFAVTLLSSAGVSAALCGVLVWLARAWIGERLRGAIQAEYAEKLETLKAQLQAEAALKLETYRATLKAQGDVELEKLRASLAIAAAERNAQAGNLLQRRFDAIATLHAQLLRVHAAGQRRQGQFTYPDAPDSRVETLEAVRAFSEAYRDWGIFLPKRTADRIDGIIEAISMSFAFVSTALQTEEPARRKLQEGIERLGRDISATVADLEVELRALMGDEPDPAVPAASPNTIPEQD